MKREFVVFDLETQRTFDEVGGYANTAKMGISIGAAYDSRDDSIQVFREQQLDALVELLFSAPLVVGFNSFKFDYTVLQPYTDRRLHDLPGLDMLDSIYRILGFRVSLDHLAAATLGRKKTGHGLDAIRWFRSGDWQKLEKYCTDDVLVTRDLYLFGCENGYVEFYDRRNRRMRRIEVNWA